MKKIICLFLTIIFLFTFSLFGCSTLSLELPSDSSIIDLSSKQDLLISGENIKTINGESILGSGNLDLSNSSDDYVLIQKVIIGYNLLTSKPSDFDSSYFNYFKTNGFASNSLDFDFIPLTSSDTWEPSKYYSFSSNLNVFSISKEPDGTPYDFIDLHLVSIIPHTDNNNTYYPRFSILSGSDSFNYQFSIRYGGNVLTSSNIAVLNHTFAFFSFSGAAQASGNTGSLATILSSPSNLLTHNITGISFQFFGYSLPVSNSILYIFAKRA